jgi:hypothetical protein
MTTQGNQCGWGMTFWTSQLRDMSGFSSASAAVALLLSSTPLPAPACFFAGARGDGASRFLPAPPDNRRALIADLNDGRADDAAHWSAASSAEQNRCAAAARDPAVPIVTGIAPLHTMTQYVLKSNARTARHARGRRKARP